MREPILDAIDAEIRRLTAARDILLGSTRSIQIGNTGNVRRRRPMSAETKRKIAAAMAKRWKERRKAA